MVRKRSLAWLAASALSITALASGAHAVPGGQSPTWCERRDGGYRCMYGPVSVPPGEMVEILAGSAAPSEAGYITKARATLVDASGDEIDHHAVHLHHAVWLNPAKRDTTCDSFEGAFPNWDRFFATGKERTTFELPPGYGYLWEPALSQPVTQSTPYWGLVAHLDGMEGSPAVFIELKLDYVPADRRTLTDVTPIWLDVRNCSSDPVYDVEKGSKVHVEKWQYRMPLGGRFVFMGGHLHDGGLRLALRNQTTGTRVFTSNARYGMHHEPWYLTRMTSLTSASGPTVRSGDRLLLRAVYDASRSWNDVMGIMVGALVPEAR